MREAKINLTIPDTVPPERRDEACQSMVGQPLTVENPGGEEPFIIGHIQNVERLESVAVLEVVLNDFGENLLEMHDGRMSIGISGVVGAARIN